MARIKSDIADQAFEYISNKINNYELKPGDTISDFLISKELEMSRTPIKEAIHHLIRLKLVRKERTKSVVTSITVEDIFEILEMRMILEIYAAEIIRERGGLTKAELKDISKINEKIDASLKTQSYYDTFTEDANFHLYLIKLCNNSRVLETYKDTIAQGKRLRWLSILTQDRLSNIVIEHNNIIKSINNLSTHTAPSEIRTHMINSYNNYKKIMNDNKNWEYTISLITQIQNNPNSLHV